MKNDYNKFLIQGNCKKPTKPGIDLVTEIVQLKEALEESEKKYNLLKENIPIGLFQTTPEGKFIYVNKWVARILGYDSTDELYSTNVSDLYEDPADRKKFIQILNESRTLNDKEVLLRQRKGSSIWAVINAKAIFDIDQKVINYEGYLYNITERKKALLQLKEREEMFSAISENLRNALYIFDTEGVFQYVNPAMLEITGYSEGELKKMKFFEIIHPDFREIVKSRGMDRLNGKSVQKTYEFKILTKEKVEKWIEISSVRLKIRGKAVVMGLGKDISDLKSSIEIIKKSETKYRTLYAFFRLMADNVQDMIWAKDLNGKYIFTNKAMCDDLLLAENVEEPVGKTNMFFANRERQKQPDNVEWYTFGELGVNTDQVVIKSRKSERFNEYGRVRGEFLYLDVIKAPLWDENGEMIGTVGSARNVTLERKIEEERQQFEKLQSVIFKIGLATGTTRDLKELIKVIRGELGKVIDTTNFYIALYDKERNSIKLPFFIDENDDFTEFPKGNTLTAIVLNRKKSLLVGTDDLKELQESGLISIVGTPAKVWLGVPLMVKNEIIGALVIQNYKDEKAYGEKELDLMEYVSNQISIAISQKQADDRLKESEKRLRQIIDTVPHMIYAKDSSGNFILANRATAKAYGLSVNEMEGHKQSELHKIEKELVKFEKDDSLIYNGSQDSITTEEKFTDHHGEEHVLQTIKIPMKTSVNNGTGILGISIDITERKKTEVELNTAKEKAEESDRLKTAFLANMSHEIRTPMNAIMGFSELLNDQEIIHEERKEYTRMISESSKMLLNLIENVIDIATIEAKQLRIFQRECHLNQLLDEMDNYFRAELTRKFKSNVNIKLVKGSNDPDLTFITDSIRLKQILSNLVGNAIKFTEKGKVEFGYQLVNEKTIQFFIKDTGIGLNPDKLNVIFERFRQADDSTTKEYGGTGLGLTIARSLIEMLGGSIWVESEQNIGSTFYFTLPFKFPDKINNEKHLADHHDQPDWSDKTILVAEDENSHFELIKTSLSRTKTIVLRAKNGREAVDLVLKNKIDLILMDIRMPVMNGYEATEIIKARFPDIPVVSLTAYAMPADIEKSIQAGCDEHISKPVKPDDLLNRMGKYLSN